MARARDIEGLEPGDSFASVASRVIEVRADEVIEHSEGALDLEDIERVHAMRVATRRLRAALEVFAPCFPRDRHKAVRREVKALADALGERRDRDVAIETLDGFAAGLAAADRPGVEGLTEKLRDEQRRANVALREHLQPQRLEVLRERVGELIAGR